MDIYNNSALYVYFDTFPSTNIPFAGVVPGYSAGLYQINATIPNRVSNGDHYVDIPTPDAETDQVTVSIAGAPGVTSAETRGPAIREPSGTGRHVALRGVAIPPRVAPVSR